MRRLLAVAVLALAACGDGLYDAAGIPVLDGGGGLVCSETQVTCAGVCTEEDATHCGTACQDCGAVSPPPASAISACVPGGPGGKGQCGYECTGGLLKCAGGCCGAVRVTGARASTYAILSNGELRAWGANEAGQLGDGGTADRSAPVPVALAQNAFVAAVAAGPAHACAVLSSGAVVCWGRNAAGQVTGSSSAASVPTPSATPVAADAVGVACGADHTCALLASGAVTCWGSNASGQLGPGPGAPVASGATALAAGRVHTCAVVGNGVTCWGDNASGQLGGAPVSGLARPLDAGIQLVAASGDHTCAGTGASNGAAIDDTVRCWGDVLGPAFGLAAPQPTPAIPLKRGNQSVIRFQVDQLATGRTHVCIASGVAATTECFGPGPYDLGQLGGVPPAGAETEGLTVPLGIASAPVAIATGDDHGCAVLPSGALRCWGANDRGQLGGGPGVPAQPAPGTLVTPLGR